MGYKSTTKILCFIVIHIDVSANLCFTYPHFCNAIAFFRPKIVVILNKTSIFAVCYYNTQSTITIKTFATMDYSLIIYKNEYAEHHLNFIRKTFKVNLETEKVVEIVGEQEHLEKVMSGMFCTDEQFKTLFPEYQTRKEREEWTSKELENLKTTIATTLCRIINQGEPSGEQFAKFRNFYLHQLCK